MHIVPDGTLHNSEVSPLTPPTSEPPTDVTGLAVWINVETQRDLNAIREAVLVRRAAVDLEFLIAKAPQRRASPRSHTFVPTGDVAVLPRPMCPMISKTISISIGCCKSTAAKGPSVFAPRVSSPEGPSSSRFTLKGQRSCPYHQPSLGATVSRRSLFSRRSPQLLNL